MKQSEKRRLKIYKKYFSSSHRRCIIFPEIRLCGKWLQDIGFNYGNFVTVEHQQNKIIITTQKEIETK